MAYVVTEACIKCKYTDCVDVCPVSCFYEGENTLAINPDECIDCCACESECPVTAIFADHDCPDDMKWYLEFNAVVTGAKDPGAAYTTGWPEHVVAAITGPGFAKWPNIAEKKSPMDSAEEASKEKGKAKDLSVKPADR